ncbi:MAG: hypothetical protein AMDU4_FER2C00042G0002 [Ferroplasma sp. Type II]|uniref:hypothetical protein n=1 Tax=Ferroplasma sp. Type II TaxID=261388 RepID=UPI0003894B56|nr:hypothetical protein [Ferroplasma sp. Type II]EQB73754.1 MAG: hypothetical protein AMDU4_FER2C00042G0002 [Ferroplasma sp. Type II]
MNENKLEIQNKAHKKQIPNKFILSLLLITIFDGYIAYMAYLGHVNAQLVNIPLIVTFIELLYFIMVLRYYKKRKV